MLALLLALARRRLLALARRRLMLALLLALARRLLLALARRRLLLALTRPHEQSSCGFAGAASTPDSSPRWQ